MEGFSPWLVYIPFGHLLLASAAYYQMCRLFWASSAPFLGTYLIEQNVNIPLILQNQLFCALSLVSWGQVWTMFITYDHLILDTLQCQYYGLKRSRLTCIVLTVSIAAIAAGLEVGMVYALRVTSFALPIFKLAQTPLSLLISPLITTVSRISEPSSSLGYLAPSFYPLG